MTKSGPRPARAVFRIALAVGMFVGCRSSAPPAPPPAAVYTDARSGYQLAETKLAQHDLAGAEGLYREVAQRFAYSSVVEECEMRLADIEEARGNPNEAVRLYTKWLFEHRGDAALAETVRAKKAEAERQAAKYRPTALTIAKLEFYVADDLAIRVAGDGRIELKQIANDAGPGWTPIGRLGADGKVTSDDGHPLGELLPDGTFRDSDGEVAPFQLFGDRLRMGDYDAITVDSHGVLQRGLPRSPVPPLTFSVQDHSSTRIDGATDAGARRTALFVFAFVLHHQLKSAH